MQYSSSNLLGGLSPLSPLLLLLCLACLLGVEGEPTEGSCGGDAEAAGGGAGGDCGGRLSAFLQKPIKLTYFDGRGLAEVPRTLLASAGLFPGEGYEDVRLSGEQFKAMKESGELPKENMNRLPVLEYDGQVVGQSSAIARYLAKQLGFFGRTDLEGAKIDALCEDLVDLKAAYRKLIPYRTKMEDQEKQDAIHKWFHTPSSPPKDDRSERQLRWFLDHLENLVGDDGFAVGGAPSLADAYLFNTLSEHDSSLEDKDYGEPFGNKAEVDTVLASYPKLRRVLDTFRNSWGMTKWLETRGPQGF